MLSLTLSAFFPARQFIHLILYNITATMPSSGSQMRILTSDTSTGGFTVWDCNEQYQLTKRKAIGQEGKGRFIQKMCSFTKHNEEFYIVGRKGLAIDIYDKCFDLLRSKRLMSTQQESDFFISLEVLDNSDFKACTGLGYVYFIGLDKLIGPNINDFGMSFGLNGPIGFFQYFKMPDERIMIGGKDREINLIELSSHKIVWKSNTRKRVTHFEDVELQKDPLWILNCVRVNHTDDSRIIAASRFGELLVYDPAISRQPLDIIQISKNPIRHLQLVKDIIFIADAFNNVILMNLHRMNVINMFRLPIGPLGSVAFKELEDARHGESRFLIVATDTVERNLSTYIVEGGLMTCLSRVWIDSTVSDILVVGGGDDADEFKRVRSTE